jgi:hypothetical protein
MDSRAQGAVAVPADARLVQLTGLEADWRGQRRSIAVMGHPRRWRGFPRSRPAGAGRASARAPGKEPKRSWSGCWAKSCSIALAIAVDLALQQQQLLGPGLRQSGEAGFGRAGLRRLFITSDGIRLLKNVGLPGRHSVAAVCDRRKRGIPGGRSTVKDRRCNSWNAETSRSALPAECFFGV